MLIGAHVRAGGGLVPALERGDEIGAEVIQVFTQSPRMWKPSQYSDEVLTAYRSAQKDHSRVQATYCHATYLINLASSDPELYAKSSDCLAANLAVARGIGSSGLVLHVGSHKGAGLKGVLPQIADALCRALEEAPMVQGEAPCPILLENAAGAGGTVGRSFDELSLIINKTKKKKDLGVCLDTQHLWASGVAFASVEEADETVKALDDAVGIDRLGCMHLNDSKVEFGANKDRHENIGDGTIGEGGLAALLGHPLLQNTPAILEVPGTGDGPREVDVLSARKTLKAGLALRD